MGGLRHEGGVRAVGVVAARHALEAQVVHGVVDGVGAQEGHPEMHLAQGVVQHPAGDLRIPMVDGAEHHQHWGDRHHHVEVGDHEVGVRQRQIDGHVAQEQPGEAAVDEGEDEADGEQHGHRQLNVAPPQGQHPVIDLDGRGHRDDEGGGGEEEAEVGVHAADVHVVRPNDEAERPDGDDGPDHHAVAEDVLAGVGGEHVGDDAEGRQGDDVHLRVAEEPKQVLEENGAAAVISGLLPFRHHGRHEEAGADQAVQNHHDAADEQRRKGQQGQHRGHEDAPDRQRQAHQRHAPGARLQHGHHIVQAAHGEADDEHAQGDEHQDDAGPGAGGAADHRLRRIKRPAGPGGAAGHEEAGHQDQHRRQIDPVADHVDIREHHVPGAAHQRDQVVAEAAEEQRRQQVDDHDHAVHGHELQVVGRIDQGEGVRPAELQAHEDGQRQGHQADAYGGDAVLDGDDLGVLAPDVFADEGLGMVKLDVLDLKRT